MAAAPFAGRAVEITAEEKAVIDKALPAKAAAKPKKPRKILLLNANVRDDGRRPVMEPAMPYLNYTITAMGKKTGAYETVFTTNVEDLRWEYLSQFDAVCFQNTQGVITKDEKLRKSLLDFVAGGKGFIAFHAGGAATFVQYPKYDQWPEFREMFGGHEDGGHPWNPNDTIHIKLDDPKNPINAVFKGQDFSIQHQAMQFRHGYSRDHLRVLMSIDVEKSDYDPVKRRVLPERREDKDFPMAWVKRYHKGRVFYTVFGHNADIAWHPVMLQHFLAGIQYAIGDLKAEDRPVKKAGK